MTVFLSSEEIIADASVKDVSALTIPPTATSALIQSDTNDVRYTMDGGSTPTQDTGMVLVNGLEPEDFLIQDIRQIRFTRGAASDAVLNIHYYNGNIDF